MTRFLPYLTFGLFVLYCAFNSHSAIHTHHLNDPDDYMRMDEVVRWLGGQGWYDLSVPRMSPGAHTVIHWSRLIDMPIAFIALLFIPFFGTNAAVMLASFIVPFLWFAVFLIVVYFLAKPFLGAERAGFACLFAAFAPRLLFNYTPGRVDHHGVQAIIAGFGLLSLGRIILDDRSELFVLLSALIFACGFWIGAEALPWVILFVACLSVIAAWRGGNVARHAALFGLFLPLFTAALVPIALPSTEFSSRALSWFSPAYAIFAALAGAVLIIGWAFGRLTEKKPLRIALYLASGFAAAALFFLLIPSAFDGIFTDYDIFDSTTALDNISEAAPMDMMLRVNGYVPTSFVIAGTAFLRFIFLPLMALIACLVAAKRARGPQVFIWLSHGVFLGAALALTLFWQNRVALFMELFMLAPLAWLLCAWWDRLRWRLWDRPLFWAEIGAFMLLGPLPVYIAPLLAHDFYSLPSRAGYDSNLDTVSATLNDPNGLGAKPHIIMNTSDTGPELLLQTKDSVISGNFDVPGNADAFTFFNSSDASVSRAIARKWHADLVLVPRTPPFMYLGRDYYTISHMRLQPDGKGMLHMVNTDPQQPLIERLTSGKIPDWLKVIEISGGSDYLLFEIRDTGNK